MTEKEIRALLEKAYDREQWKQLVTALFPGRDVFARPVEHEATTVPGKKLVQKILQFGDVQLTDGNVVGLFEVSVARGVDLAGNRVAIRKAIEQPVKQSGNSGALIVFVDGEHGIWRFSFYSNTLKEDGTWDPNNPKRYTYLLGLGEKCLTAARQFDTLARKTGPVTLKDLLEAFSVEKVGKAFFREYKEHYQDFVQHLTGKRMVKKASKWEEKVMHPPSPKLATFFNGNEKDARDFCKKLMGRLVFLYFLQKKRWLGASSTAYADGDTDFVYHLFKATGGEAFYPTVLTTLFFGTLNAERADDDYVMPDKTTRKVPFLNGGLFDMDALDRKAGNLTFPPELFCNPASAEDENDRGFLDFLNAYNFTVHEAGPEEQTLAVDPEMLGHIFENLLEDNKDKGAFYTPKEIVHYMCQESLTQYLKNYLAREVKGVKEDATLEDHLRNFLKDGTGAPLSTYSGPLLKALREVKVCDPAIGSGAFPMGILHEVFQAVYHLQEFSPDEFSSIWGLAQWEPAEVKLRIIQHSIYGVDIERGAVDIARLRFWLSIIVDEPTPRTLPNLDYKIVVGDSLLGRFNGEVLEIDWDLKGGTDRVNEVRDVINDLHARTERFFRDQTQEKKAKLALEIRNLKIKLLIKQVELNRDKFRNKNPLPSSLIDLTRAQQLKAQKVKEQLAVYAVALDKLNGLLKHPDRPLNYFDWQLDFPEVLNPNVAKDQGFDIVIANPPYVKEATNKAAFDGLRKHPLYQGKMDLWYLFAAQGIQLCRTPGVVCYIATNNWVTNDGASLLRDFVLDKARLYQFVDFGDYKVFESAGIQTMITLWSKEQHVPEQYSLYHSHLKATRADNFLLESFLQQTVDDLNEHWTKRLLQFRPANYRGTYVSFWTDDLIDRMRSGSRLNLRVDEIHSGIDVLQDFVTEAHIQTLDAECPPKGSGIFVLSDEERIAFKTSPTEAAVIKKYYTTAEIDRYKAIEKNKYWIIYSGATVWKNIDRYPNIKKHLDRFASVMTSDNRPYGLHRTRKEEIFLGEKILSTRKAMQPSFSYVPFDAYVSRSFLVLRTRRVNLRCLTGILNSRAAAYWLSRMGKMQGHQYQIDVKPLCDIPIPQLSSGVERKLATLVGKRTSTTDDVIATALEREIDVLVCKLYGLSWAQAKVVDPELGLSQAEYDAIQLPEAEGPTGQVAKAPGVTGLTDEGTLFGQPAEEVSGGSDDQKMRRSENGRAGEAKASSPRAAVSNLPATQAILSYLKANTGWHGKSAILAATGIEAGPWNATIKELLDAGKVERQGEKKGAKYRVA